MVMAPKIIVFVIHNESILLYNVINATGRCWGLLVMLESNGVIFHAKMIEVENSFPGGMGQQRLYRPLPRLLSGFPLQEHA